jgi:hypothetical protein
MISNNNNDITSLAAPLNDLDLTTSPMNVESAGPSVCTAPQIKPSTFHNYFALLKTNHTDLNKLFNLLITVSRNLWDNLSILWD